MRASILSSPDAESESRPGRRIPLKHGILALVLAGILLVSLAYYEYAGSTGPPNPTGTGSWQQWGMQIDHPAGLNAQYQGVLEQQATSHSGLVEWIWHGGDTSLLLFWENATAYNFTAGFQQVSATLHTRGSGVILLGHGNLTMGGATWEYQTYNSLVQGKSVYATYAYAFSTPHQRVYGVTFGDVASDTLASLIVYGQTFKG